MTDTTDKNQISQGLGAERQPPTKDSDAGCGGIRAPMRLKEAHIESTEAGWKAYLTMSSGREEREAFAVMVAGILDSDPAAVNYIEMRVVHPAGREYAVICQRVEGKTPAQRASEETVRAAAAARDAERLREALRRLADEWEKEAAPLCGMTGGADAAEMEKRDALLACAERARSLAEQGAP